MNKSVSEAVVSKVPAVTLGFWIIKILATTLGETGGDTVSMTWLGETTSGQCRGRTAIWSARRSSALLLVAAGLGADPRARNSIRGSTGRRSSPRPPSARRWPTSPTARSASAMPAARCCCSPACCCRCSPGTGRSARVAVDTVSSPQSRDLLLGHHHLLADARAPRSATGPPTRGLGYSGGALVVRRGAGGARRPLFLDQRQPRRCCSGRPSS